MRYLEISLAHWFIDCNPNLQILLMVIAALWYCNFVWLVGYNLAFIVGTLIKNQKKDRINYHKERWTISTIGIENPGNAECNAKGSCWGSKGSGPTSSCLSMKLRDKIVWQKVKKSVNHKLPPFGKRKEGLIFQSGSSRASLGKSMTKNMLGGPFIHLHYFCTSKLELQIYMSTQKANNHHSFNIATKRSIQMRKVLSWSPSS